ncbi:MAG: class I SAM-dependent methyltransferase [Deltaproteobacteria bacterium]|nr:class I SAM-dependent methyltransferase [Deltaproteobacteria bacterium]
MPKAAQFFPNSESLILDTGIDIDVFQCPGCGLVQLSNEPVPYYREVIRSAAVSPLLLDSKEVQLYDFLDKYSLHGKKVIEIGCGRGEFLSLLPFFDVDAYGLEYSDASVAFCLENGLRVEKGFPDRDNVTLASGPFDAFLLLMFLEHIPEPNIFLQAIYNNVTEEAVGLIEVPNFDMILEKGLFSEFVVDHLFYFSKDTLQRTLQFNGFDVVDCNELRDGYVISMIVKKRDRLDISLFHDHRMALVSDIAEYINRFGEKRVAIWGAGHQALSFISLSGIEGKIRYVVDSALFKQGKYTPATHLPVVPPKTLHSDPVSAIIVMAASYSDEIVRLLLEDFPAYLNIAVLRDFGLEIISSPDNK